MLKEHTVNDKISNFGCKLFIDTENDHPKVVSDALNVVASEYFIKGEQCFNSKTKKIIEGKFNKSNLWVFSIERQHAGEGIYLNKSLEIMLSIFDQNKDAFLNILRKYPQNHILCYAYFFEVNPYFIFDKTLIERLSYYKVDVEFDIYCLAE